MMALLNINVKTCILFPLQSASTN